MWQMSLAFPEMMTTKADSI